MSLRLSGLNPLAYIGVEPTQPPQFVVFKRAPTTNDSQNWNIGSIWLHKDESTSPVTYDVYMLVSLTEGIAIWILFAGASGTVLGLKAADGNTAFPTNGIINIGQGNGIVTTASGDTVTIAVAGNVATTYTTQSGNAIPAANVLNVFGAHGINTTGSGNTVTAAINNAITLGDLSNLAAGVAALTAQTGDITIVANSGASGNFNMPDTINDDVGIITFDGDRFVHKFGTFNTFIGQNSGNTTMNSGLAVRNCSLGVNTLSLLTTGDENIAIGAGALGFCDVGNSNIAIGDLALNVAEDAAFNIAIGIDSMIGTISSTNNIAIGQRTLDAITTGAYNIAIGDGAGSGLLNTDESDNILIGNDGLLNDNNTIRIGNSGTGIQQQNRCFIAGIRGITTGVNDAVAVLIDSAGQLGTTSSSLKFKMNVRDMGDDSSALMRLRPVIFNYKEDATLSKQWGLIAEEVAEVMPSLVANDSNGEPYSVRYHDLPAILLNELQKQYKKISELTSRLEILEGRLKA